MAEDVESPIPVDVAYLTKAKVTFLQALKAMNLKPERPKHRG